MRSKVANTHEAFSVRVGARGRLVLPAKIRRQLDLEEGDRVLFTVEQPGVLRMTTAREVVRRARGALREATGDRDLVAELLAERRRGVEDGRSSSFRSRSPASSERSLHGK
jgi:AbrB family looped-hinge helix DNA binding protein